MAGNPVVADNVETFPPRVRMMEPRRIRCAFRAGESTFYPYIDEVIRIQARRNYSEVFVTAGSFTVREVLVSLERRLAQFGFFRVQRSSIINLGHVVEIRRERRGRYAVVLSDGSAVIVPPAVKERLEQLLAVD
jgi:DNA-binding LytR/AlgR family response regulator